MLRGLQEGDTLVNGRLIGADGQEIAVVDDHLVDEARRRVEAGELTDTGQIHRIYKSDPQ